MRYVDFLFPASCPVLLRAVSFKGDFCLPTKWFQIKHIFWLFLLSWLLLIAFVWYYLSRLTALHMFFGACWVILCFHNLPVSGMDYKMTGSLTHICDVFACVSTWGTSSLIRVVLNWYFHSVLCFFCHSGGRTCSVDVEWPVNVESVVLSTALCHVPASCCRILPLPSHLYCFCFIALLTSCLIPLNQSLECRLINAERSHYSNCETGYCFVGSNSTDKSIIARSFYFCLFK